MTEIKFLGTSSGWPFPRLGCGCPICTSKDPKDKRWRPSLLLDGKVLIDATPDLYHQLAKEGAGQIEACFLTHSHPDHIFGLWDLSHLYTQNRRLKKIKIYSAASTLKVIRRSSSLQKFEIFPIKHGSKIDINGLEITAFEVIHTKVVDPTLGFLINGKLAYIPDFRKIPKKSEKFLKEKILVLGAVGIKKGWSTPTHLSIPDVIALAKKLSAKALYLTNVSHSALPHAELEDYLQEKGGKNYHGAYDGLRLEI